MIRDRHALALCALLVIAFATVTSVAIAADSFDNDISTAAATVSEIARVVGKGDLTDYAYISSGYCFLTAYLQPGNVHGLKVELEAGKEYAFVGASDYSETDLTVTVKDSDGNQVGKTIISHDLPMVLIQPRTSGNYTVRLILDKTATARFCTLAILEKDGRYVSRDDIYDAELNCEISASIYAEDIGKDMEMSKETNTWVLAGAVLKDSESIGLQGVSLGSHKHAFVTTSNDELASTMTTLKDSSDNELASKEDILESIVSWDTSYSETYSFDILLTETKDDLIVFTAIMDVN